MADNLDPLDQLIQQEQQQKADAAQVVGEHQATVEQDDYQSQIDQRRAQQPQPGLLSRLGSDALDVGDAVWYAGMHPIDTLEHAWNGLVQGSAMLPYTAESAGFHAAAAVGAVDSDTVNGFLNEEKAGYQADAAKLSFDNTDQANKYGSFVQGIAQWYAGKRALGALGAGDTVASIGAMTAAFDPNDKNLNDTLAKIPGLPAKVQAALATDPNDPEWENRLRAVGAGVAAEAGASAAGAVVTWLRGAGAVKQINQTAADIEATPSTPVTMPEGAGPTVPAAATEGSSGAAAGATTGELKATEGSATAPAEVTTGATEGSAAVTPEANHGSAEESAATAPAGTPQAQPEAASAVPQAAPEVLHPATPGIKIDIPPEKAGDVLQAINEGRYADAVGLMDDTHRTIPWDQLSDGPALKNVFAAVEDGVGRLIKGAAGVASVPQQAIVQLAKDIGGNVESLNRLYSGVTGEGGLAARITAGYNMMVASARQLKELAANVNQLRPDSPEGAQALLDFQKQLNLHGAIVGQVRQSSAEIGRALWAHRQLKASSAVELSNIHDYAGTTTGTANLQKLAKSITDAGDLRSMTNASDAVQRGGFWAAVREIGTNGMLSGPATQLRNAAGLLTKTAYSMAERYVAAGIGTAQRLIDPASDAATFREAVAHTNGVGEGIKAAAKMAWESLKDENYTSPFNQPMQTAIQRSTDGRVGADLWLSRAVNALGTVVRFPGRIMGLMDHFSQNVGYWGDLNAAAYKQAATEADAQGLTAAARDTFMDQRIADLKANPTTEINQHAMDAGSYQAFLEKPQTSVGQPMMNFFNSNPWLKFFVAPFVHRPGNIMRQGLLDYSPLGFAKPSTWSTLAAGGSDSSMALARPLMGTGIALTALDLAANGRLTGSRLGPNNTETLDGIPPYSVKIGDTWYRYDGIDPIGMQLGAIANMHEFAQRHWDPNNSSVVDTLKDTAQTVVQSLANTAFDKSFMKSMDQVMKAAGEKDPDKADAEWSKLVADNVSKFVPFSGALGAAAKFVDPTQRSTLGGGPLTDVVARLPGLSETLPPRRDLLGRPVPVTSWWNPFAGAPVTPDSMDTELSKLAVQIRPPARTMFGYQLTPKEYDEVLTNATQSPIFTGQTLEQSLRDLTSSQDWSDRMKTSDGVAENAQQVQKMIDGAYSAGSKMFQADHPNMLELKQQHQQDRFKSSVDAVQRSQQGTAPTLGSVPTASAGAQAQVQKFMAATQ